MLRKGFTLIEIVIALGIFAILAYVGTNVYISAVRNSARISIENEVRQTGSGIFADIAAEIRKSKCIYFATSGSDKILNVSNVSGNVDCTCGASCHFVQYKVTSAGVATKNINNAGATTLNSGNAVLLSCTGGTAQCKSNPCTVGLNYDTSVSPAVLSVTTQQPTTVSRSDYCANYSINDTVVARTIP